MEKLASSPTPPLMALTKRQSAQSETHSSSSGHNGSTLGGEHIDSSNGCAYNAVSMSSPTPRSFKSSGAATSNTVVSPRIDRSVQSRTLFQITLPHSTATGSTTASALAGPAVATSTLTSSSNCSATGETTEPQCDQRGWSSPHGEPYRPLGKPNLSLKFSPRLANGTNVLQNAHRMKVFEAKDAAQQDREKSELRHAQTAAATIGSTAAGTNRQNAHAALFDLFPLNFATKNRPLNERQVKLAHRLHTSVSHYAPERVHRLRRPVATSSMQYDDALHGAAPPRPSARGADALSVDVLRRAIHECSSRLRMVKNGGGFLTNVATSEHIDLHALQNAYRRERQLYYASSHSVSSHGSGSSSTPHRAAFALLQHHDYTNSSDEDSARRTVPTDDDVDMYLPYTTRHIQRSPTKRHPSLEAFKSKTQNDKLAARPLLSMQSTSASTTIGSSRTRLSLSPRSPAGRTSMRASRVGSGNSSLLVALRPSDRVVDSVTPLAAVPPPATTAHRRGSIAPLSLASSVVTSYAALVTDGGLRGGHDGVSSNAAAAATAKQLQSPPNRKSTTPQHQHPLTPTTKQLHSVERLQAAVTAIDASKVAHAKQFARAVEWLAHDRRDCLTLKFQHVCGAEAFDTDVRDDLAQMRLTSDAERIDTIDASVERTAWYIDLLKQLLVRDTPLHPAELLVVRAIQRTANAGHAVDKQLLFRMLLLVHHDDLRIADVQQLLTLVRQALDVGVDEWAAFFRTHGLPEPLEVTARKQAIAQQQQEEQQPHERKQSTLLVRFRAVVALNKAVRHLSHSEVKCSGELTS